MATRAFHRVSSWAKSAVYRATTSSMVAGRLQSTARATSGCIVGGWASASWSVCWWISADRAANWSRGTPANAFQGPTTGSVPLLAASRYRFQIVINDRSRRVFSLTVEPALLEIGVRGIESEIAARP